MKLVPFGGVRHAFAWCLVMGRLAFAVWLDIVRFIRQANHSCIVWMTSETAARAALAAHLVGAAEDHGEMT